MAVVFTSAAIGACSHGDAPGTTAAEIGRVPELPLAALVDPAARGAVRLDMTTLTNSPYFTNVADWIDLATEGSSSSDSTMVRIGLRAREITLFLIEGQNGAPRAVALLRGRFTMEDAVAFQQRGREGGDRPRGPFLVHDQGMDGAVVLLGNHTLALGDRDAVNGVVDRQIAGGGGRYPTADAFGAIARQVGFESNPIGFVVVPSDAMRNAASQGDDPALQALGSAQALGVGLDLSQGIRGRAVIQLDSAMMAMGLVTIGRVRLASLASEAEVVETGLAALLSRVTLSREGGSVTADLDAPDSDVRPALTRFTEFLRGQAGH